MSAASGARPWPEAGRGDASAWQGRRFSLPRIAGALTIAAVGLLALGAWGYGLERASLGHQVGETPSIIARLKADQLAASARERWGDSHASARTDPS